MIRCNDDGGQGVGAGHVCRCVRPAGHSLDAERPHGCPCGAPWADRGDLTREEYRMLRRTAIFLDLRRAHIGAAMLRAVVES